jgi:hypothetical protein
MVLTYRSLENLLLRKAEQRFRDQCFHGVCPRCAI